MRHFAFRIRAYIRHQLRSLISKWGFGVHSPFAFDIITNLIHADKDTSYYCFDKIEKLRKETLAQKDIVSHQHNKSISLGRIARSSSSKTIDGQRMMRLAAQIKAKHIIELGTSLGFGTAYLASSNKLAEVTTIDHEKEIQEIAKQHLAQLDLHNIDFINDRFSNALPLALAKHEKVDLVFFDGHHKGHATEYYFNTALPYSHKHSVFVFHDIHWSKAMYKSWLKISKSSLVGISIECHNMGILFFNTEHQKQHFYA